MYPVHICLTLMFVLCNTLFFPGFVVATESPVPYTAELFRIRTDQGPALAVKFKMAPGYYVYANDSVSGRPTRLGLFRGDVPVDGEVRYPPAVLRTDSFTGKSINAYADEATVFLQIPSFDASSLSLGISMLACSSGHCIPIMARQTLDPDLPESDALLDTWRQAVPGKALRTAPRSISASHVPPVAMSTLPLTPLTSIQDAQAVGIPSLPHTSLVPSSAWNFEPRVDGDDEEPSGLLSALAWGMIAGLILNVMPCVLPVLTLKMSALLHAAGERTERIRRFREHNLFFAAGVLTWFCILALAVSLLGLTWGGLFQFPFLVAALAVLMCLLALSMLDICTLPVIDLKAGTSGSPRSQAFLTGLTATLLATPCSGPLLGGVLAWSAMQPPHIALIVFLGVGLGMSLPYLMFSLWPHTVSLLPRPGAWLLVLERIVGIFLLGTTMYLLVLLPRTWAPVLAAILTLVAGVMTWQHAARFRLSRPSARTVLTLLCGVALTGCLLALGGSESVTLSESEQFRQGSSPWEQFTPEAFSRALGSEPIVLQFTADWYPNCKVLEMTTLQSERMRRLQQRYGLRLFIVDMTESDPDQERLLRSLKSISIPLTALFAPGAASHEPVILRDTYMPSRLEAALATLLKDGS